MQVINKIENRISGFVKISVYNPETKEEIDFSNIKSDLTSLGIEYLYNLFNKITKGIHTEGFKKNTTVINSRMVCARLLGGYNQFKADRIEWGWGNTPTQKSDTDIAGPFTPRVFTNITTKEYLRPNVIRFITTLTNETLTYPSSAPPSPYPFIREVGLRTGPIASDPVDSTPYPNGVLIARFVNAVDVPKVTSNFLNLQWLYIFN